MHRRRGATVLPRYRGDDRRWYFGQGKWAGRRDKPLYRQDEAIIELRMGGEIFICEGERDADSVWDTDNIAVCNPDGAGCFREHHAQILIDAMTSGDDHPDIQIAGMSHSTITILADSDDAGLNHAKSVYKKLTRMNPRLRQRIQTLLPPDGYKDISDFLARGPA